MALKDRVARNAYVREWKRKKALALGKKPRAKTSLEKFFRHVNKTETCWLWTAKDKNDYGHGMFREIPDKPRAKTKHIAAHRWLYQQIYKVILKKDQYCCHKCDDPSCVNPEHIFIGSQKDNIQDAVKKGRHSSNRLAEKTHCPSGHEYTPKNTKIMKHKYGRQCIECSRIWAKERYHRLKSRDEPRTVFIKPSKT